MQGRLSTETSAGTTCTGQPGEKQRKVYRVGSSNKPPDNSRVELSPQTTVFAEDRPLQNREYAMTLQIQHSLPLRKAAR